MFRLDQNFVLNRIRTIIQLTHDYFRENKLNTQYENRNPRIRFSYCVFSLFWLLILNMWPSPGHETFIVIKNRFMSLKQLWVNWMIAKVLILLLMISANEKRPMGIPLTKKKPTYHVQYLSNEKKIFGPLKTVFSCIIYMPYYLGL